MMLFGQTLKQLQTLCVAEGFQKYTAKQLCDWMYKKRVNDFDAMTNLSLSIRARLNAVAVVGRSLPVDCQTSSDGTKKYLFQEVDTGSQTYPSGIRQHMVEYSWGWESRWTTTRL